MKREIQFQFRSVKLLVINIFADVFVLGASFMMVWWLIDGDRALVRTGMSHWVICYTPAKSDRILKEEVWPSSLCTEAIASSTD